MLPHPSIELVWRVRLTPATAKGLQNGVLRLQSCPLSSLVAGCPSLFPSLPTASKLVLFYTTRPFPAATADRRLGFAWKEGGCPSLFPALPGLSQSVPLSIPSTAPAGCCGREGGMYISPLSRGYRGSLPIGFPFQGRVRLSPIEGNLPVGD